MALYAAPPSTITSHLLADWLELTAFASPEGSVSIQDVNEALEIEEDFEPEAIHDEDNLKEACVQAAASAIEERLECMENAYPFDLLEGGHLLVLESEWTTAGRAGYLLCLLLSHVSGEGLLVGDPLPELMPARDLFQVCATLCAAGAYQGPAFSFGWPRPDKTSYHQKLLEVFKHFGDGVPHKEPPAGSPPRIKDGGIDVIAWSFEPDGRPGRNYLLGQAASGQNWEDKSVGPFIKLFHDFWFLNIPASTPNPAMFVPFCLPEPEDTDYSAQKEIYQGHLRYLTHLLGTIFYRYRIPRHVSRAIALAAEGIGPIERLDSVVDVVAWISRARNLLLAEAR